MDKKEYIDRGLYCETICRCNGSACDKSKCPIWTAPAAEVAPRAEVAAEIFAEIDAEFGENCGAYRIDDVTYGQIWDFIANLKKKYTEIRNEST